MATSDTAYPSRGDPNLTSVSPEDDARTILVNNVSWGGVLAGVVAALVTQLILNLIGIGIGASTLNPTTGDNPTASGFSASARASGGRYRASSRPSWAATSPAACPAARRPPPAPGMA